MNHSRFCSDGLTVPLWEAHGSHFEKFMASLWVLIHSVNQQVVGRGIFDFCPQDAMFRGLDCLFRMQSMSLQGTMAPQLCILQDTQLFLFILSKSPSVASIMDSKKWGLGGRWGGEQMWTQNTRGCCAQWRTWGLRAHGARKCWTQVCLS